MRRESGDLWERKVPPGREEPPGPRDRKVHKESAGQSERRVPLDRKARRVRPGRKVPWALRERKARKVRRDWPASPDRQGPPVQPDRAGRWAIAAKPDPPDRRATREHWVRKGCRG